MRGRVKTATDAVRRDGNRITGRGAACHTGRKSCFYRALEDGALKDSGEPRLFDPRTVYGA